MNITILQLQMDTLYQEGSTVMKPPFLIKVTEINARIFPLHRLRKNTSKYSMKRI